MNIVSGPLQTGGTQRLDASGNLSNIGTYSGSGNITTSGKYLQGTFLDGTPTNYLPNGSFETDTAGWGANALTTLARTTTQSYVGAASLNVKYSGAGDGYASYTLPTVPTTFANRTYTFSLWAKASLATNTLSSVLLQTTGASFNDICSLGTISLSTSWQQYKATCTAPAGYTNTTWRAILRPSTDSTVEVYYDGITIQSGTSATQYTNISADDSGNTVLYDGNLGIGVASPTGKLHVAGTIIGSSLVSNVATGTAPLTVTSTTVVTNLNADLLDGQTASFFQDAANLNTGIVGVARGGTGVGAVGVAGSVAYSTGAAYAFSAVGTSGECLISSGAASPTWGSCGGAGTVLQGGNSFAATMTIGTNDVQSLVLETGGAARLTITGTGDATYAGTLTVGAGSGEAVAKIDGGSTGSQRLSFTTAASTTWSIGAIGGGANPSFQVQRYNAGAYVDSPLSINNSTGATTLTGAVTVTGNFTQASGDFSLMGPGTMDVSAVRMISSAGALYLQSGNGNAIYLRNASGGVVGTIDTTNSNLTMNGAVYASNWLRTYGATGWYSETYGGGWHMSDASWIRSYGSKNVYMDQGFDTGGAAGVSCGGGLGAGYNLRVCGTTYTSSIMYAAGGTYTQLIGGGSSNGVCHNGADVDGAATGDMRALMVCNATPGDYAEFYPAEQGVEAGDLVATTDNMLHYEAFGADPETGQTYSMGMQDISIVKKARIGDKGIGIISTGPWQVIGKDIPRSANRKPVALNGRVPLKVNDEGGAIQPGDRLTLSSVAGYAKKATARGMTYAVALEAFSGTSGKILVYVDNNYYEPAVGAADLQGTSLALSGEATIGGSLHIGGPLNVSGSTTLGGLTVREHAEFQGTLVARDAEFTGTLSVNGHIVSRGSRPTVAAGQALGSAGATASVDGTDTAGTIVLTSDGAQTAGVIARIGFQKAFDTSYKVVLSATNEHAADLRVYVVKTATGFDVVARSPLTTATQYQFDYIVVGADGQ